MKAESRQIPQKLAARLKFVCWHIQSDIITSFKHLVQNLEKEICNSNLVSLTTLYRWF